MEYSKIIRYPVIVSLLAILLASSAVAQPGKAGDPSFYIVVGYGDVHSTNPGGMNDALRTDGGWLKHVPKLEPQLKWAGSEGHEFGVIIDRPFGHWRPGNFNAKGEHEDQYELDSYDWANASGQRWMYADFAKAWQGVCDKHRVLPYLGNVAGHPELASLPPAEMATMIRRNCKPFEDAGCYQVIIDTGALAITQPHYNAKRLVRPRTIEAFTLLTIDRMKFARTAVEPVPPNHGAYADIHTRDCHVAESVYAMYHKRSPATDRVQDDGYSPDTSYVKGRIHRWVLPAYVPGAGSEAERVVERCREVVAAGHVPCVPAWLLMGNCKPSDFLGAAK